MKKIILIILLCIASNNAFAKHPIQNMYVQNFAREIEPSNLKSILPHWVEILKKAPIIYNKELPTLEKLNLVNNRVNSKGSFAFSPWMTPKEFYVAKHADCKGYAVTKYYELRKLGWKPEELNLWEGDYDGHSHITLVARLGEKQYVLDIMDQSLPEAKYYFYKHFIPAFRFNEYGWDGN